MRSIRTTPLHLPAVSLLILGLVGGLLAFPVYPGYAQGGDPPAKPTGLEVSVVSGVGVNLSWDDPDDATITGSEILRRDRKVHGQGEFVPIESDTGSQDTTYTDATVVADNAYVYRVKAINAHGKSKWSFYARADVPEDYEAPEPAPAPADLAPTNLTAAVVEGGVSLAWDAPAEDAESVTGYAILRAVGEGELTVLEADTGNATRAYTDATATEKGTTYSYQVEALRGEVSSQGSNEAQVQVPHDPADLAPTNLTAAVVDGGVSLAWNAPAEEASSVSGYRIFRAVGEGELTVLQADTGNATNAYTDSTATEGGTTYSYMVKALRDGEPSQGSNEAEVQVPHDPADLAPSGLTAQLTEGGVSLSWDEPAEEADSVTGYAILRAVGEGELTVLAADTGNATNAYTDATATEGGTTYSYQVKALRGDVSSQGSNEAQVQVPHDPVDLAPSGLTAAVVDGGVSLNWNPPAEEASSVTGYTVLRAVGEGELTTLEGNTSDTSYTDATATEAGTTYSYQVKALRGQDQSQASNEAEAQVPDTAGTPEPTGEPPAKPQSLQASIRSGVGIKLHWARSGDESITSYEILRRDVGVHGPGVFVTIDTVNSVKENETRSYTDATVEADHSYVYRIRAVNASGASEQSNYIRVNVPQGYQPPPPEAEPTPESLAPTGLTAAAGHDGVSLNWNAPAKRADSVTGYRVHREQVQTDAHGNANVIMHALDTGSNAISYTDTTATEVGETYSYRVTALRGEQESVPSNRADAQIPTDPRSPTGLTASLGDNGDVSLNWEAPTDDDESVTGYRIERAVDVGVLTTLEENTGGTGTSYTDNTSTAAGATYSYQVKALRGEEQSAASNRAAVQIPHDPADLAPSFMASSVRQGGEGQSAIVTLLWAAPAEDAGSVTGYRILRGPAGDDLKVLWSDTGNTNTSYTDYTVEHGATYYYAVVALRDGEASEPSGTRMVTTPDAPTPDDSSNIVTVPRAWALKPAGVGAGEYFRLLFVSSLTRNARSRDIGTYNSFIQARAAAGFSTIQEYSSQFRVVGGTAAVSARDNTETTYTSDAPGVPIYWLAGNKVADDYEDFYDGDWDDETNPKNESGGSVLDSHIELGIFTGSDGDGSISEKEIPLGHWQQVALGFLDSDFVDTAESRVTPLLSTVAAAAPSMTRPFYGLSPVFRVAPEVPEHSQFSPGDFVIILDNDQPQITLSFVPSDLFDGLIVAEKVGTVAVGLRAETAGNVKPSEDFHVVVRSSDDTAKAGQDYVAFSETYTFSAAAFQLEGGVYVLTVTHDLEIIDDDVTEKGEQLLLPIDTSSLPEHVSIPRGANGAVHIQDEDATTISVAPLDPVDEGEDVVLTFMLDKLVPFEFSFSLINLSGTATRGEDFEQSEAVTFTAGVTELTARISTVEDDLDEDDETFTIRLVRGGLFRLIVLPDEDLTVTILDDDHSPLVKVPSLLRIPDHSTEITNLGATDADGDALTWEITGGADQDLFNLTGDGALSFKSQQSYHSPGDSDGDGVYHVNARVTDGANPVEHPLTVELWHETPGVQVRDVTADSVLIVLDRNRIHWRFMRDKAFVIFRGTEVAASLEGSGNWYRWFRLQPDSEYTATVMAPRPNQDAQPTGLEATFRTAYVKLGEIEIGEVTPTTAQVTVPRADVGGYNDHVVYLRYRADGGSWSDPISVGGTTSAGPITDFITKYHEARFTLTGLEEETAYDVQAYLDPEFPDNPSGVRQGRWRTLNNAFTTSPPPIAPTPVYEATMEIGTDNRILGYSENAGSLSPTADFSYRGGNYTIDNISFHDRRDTLELDIRPGAFGDVNAELGESLPEDLAFVLRLDNEEFSSDSENIRIDSDDLKTTVRWYRELPADWSGGDTVPVELLITVDICGRSPLVKRVILDATPAADTCDAVSPTDLEAITHLDFPEQTGLSWLQQGDFEGLVNLTHLDMSNAGIHQDWNHWIPGTNQPVTLAGIFDPLVNLVELDLSGNPLNWVIEPGFFDGLANLEVLRLRDLELQPALHPETFSNLANLRELDMRGYAKDDSLDALQTSAVAFWPLTGLQTYNGEPYATPPEPPLNLRVTVLPIPVPEEVTSGWQYQHTFTLQWDAPVDGAILTGYRIKRAYDVEHPENYPRDVTRTGRGVTHYTDGRDRSIRLGTRGGARLFHPTDGRQSVKYLVSALYGDGTESLPAYIVVTEGTDPPEAAFKPSENIDLRVETYRDHRHEYYRLTWDEAEDLTVTGYEIQSRASGEEWETVVADTGNVTLYDYHVLWDIKKIARRGDDLPGAVAFRKTSSNEHEFRIRPLNAAGAGCWDADNVCRESDEDFNTLQAANNRAPRGLHVHDGIMYVSDSTGNGKVYAYNLSSKARDTSREFDIPGTNNNVRGIWSNGQTMWVANIVSSKLEAFKFTTGTDYGDRDSDRTIDLATGHTSPEGIWSNGQTMWVVNYSDHMLYAYKMTEGTTFGDRDSDKDISLVTVNGDPRGIWSNGVTVWVLDDVDHRVYAYNLSSKARDEDKEFDLATDNGDPRAIVSDGQTMWVSDVGDEKLYAYLLPGSFFE